MKIWVFRRVSKSRIEALIFQEAVSKGSGWVGVETAHPAAPDAEAAARALSAKTGLQLQASVLRLVEGAAGLFAVLISGEKPPIQPDRNEYQAYSWIPAPEVDSLLKSAADRKTFQRALAAVSKS